MSKFKDILNLIKKNDQNLTSVYTYEIDDAQEVKDRFTRVPTVEQVKQLAMSMPYNTNITSIVTGYYTFSAPEELKPYLELIDNCIERNKKIIAIEHTKFGNYIKSDLSNFLMRPVVIMADLGKRLFSNTLGLEPVLRFVRRIGPGHYHFELPTITVALKQAWHVVRYLKRDYLNYPVIGVSSIEYAGSYLSLPLAINNYIFRNLGKLVGVALTLPFTPFLAIAAIGKSILNFRTDKLTQDRELATAERNIQTNLSQLASNIENSFELGEIYRDFQDFDKALVAYNSVAETDDRFPEAMFEAGSIAIAKKDIPEARKAFKKGLAAVKEEDVSLKDTFVELLKNLGEDTDSYEVMTAIFPSDNSSRTLLEKEGNTVLHNENYNPLFNEFQETETKDPLSSVNNLTKG